MRLARRPPLPVAALLATLLSLASPARPQGDVVAIVGADLVPMTSETVVEGQTVLVRDGIIAAIGPASELDVPEGAFVVDGSHCQLLPGYTDAHTHLTSPDQLWLCLARGVTTVCDLGGGPERMAWRDAIASGDLVGPTIYAARTPLIGLRSPGEARRTAEADVRAGWDILKPYDDMSPEVYAALVEAGRERGLVAFSHVPRNLTPPDVLAARPAAIAHGEEFLYSWFLPDLDESAIPATRELVLEAGSAVVANLIAFDFINRQLIDAASMQDIGETRYVPYVVRRSWEPRFNRYVHTLGRSPVERRAAYVEHHRERYLFLRRMIADFQRAGVPILVGTDASDQLPFVVPGFATLRELDQLVVAGLTPYEALVAATRAPAEVLGRADEFGTIEVGKRADLVLVKGDVLEDITSAGLIVGVMARGRWHPGSELREGLDEIAQRYAEEGPAVRLLIDAGLDGRPRTPGQAVGEPDAFDAEGYGRIWYPPDDNGKDWLELEFVPTADVRSLRVHGSLGQRGVTSITLSDRAGGHTTLAGPAARGIRGFTDGLGVTEFILPDPCDVVTVRFEMDQSRTPGVNAVDAVALVDAAGRETWASTARASVNSAEQVAMGFAAEGSPVPAQIRFKPPSAATLLDLALRMLGEGRWEDGLALLRAGRRWYPEATAIEDALRSLPPP